VSLERTKERHNCDYDALGCSQERRERDYVSLERVQERHYCNPVPLERDLVALEDDYVRLKRVKERLNCVIERRSLAKHPSNQLKISSLGVKLRNWRFLPTFLSQPQRQRRSSLDIQPDD